LKVSRARGKRWKFEGEGHVDREEEKGKGLYCLQQTRARMRRRLPTMPFDGENLPTSTLLGRQLGQTP
jgi:hypothetical protein